MEGWQINKELLSVTHCAIRADELNANKVYVITESPLTYMKESECLGECDEYQINSFVELGLRLMPCSYVMPVT